MTDTENLLDVIAVLVEELGTELELEGDEELALLAGTPTLAALERGAEALRRNRKEIPPVVGSLLMNVHRAAERRRSEIH